MGKYTDLARIEKRLLDRAKEDDWEDLDFQYTEDKRTNKITLVIDLYCDADPSAGLNAGRAIWQYFLDLVCAEDEFGLPIKYKVTIGGEFNGGHGVYAGFEPISKDFLELAQALGDIAADEIFQFEYYR